MASAIMMNYIDTYISKIHPCTLTRITYEDTFVFIVTHYTMI